MPPRTRTAAPRARRYDAGRVRAALAAQTAVLRQAVHSLCTHPDAEALLAAPTRLGEWTVADLVVHLGFVLDWIPVHLDDPVPEGDPLSVTDWALATRTAAAAIAEAPQRDAGVSPAELVHRFDTAADALTEVLDGPAGADPARRITTRFGTILLADYLVTRLLETVVHGDDLAEAVDRAARVQGVDNPVPAPGAFPHDRQALAATTRLLADTLAGAVPGGAVELRVPPYAVVQFGAGPRHTRGTPPNVVEAGPLTWIRLATGRTAWAAAVEEGAVSASGERSDLSSVLPVMA